MQPFSLMTRLGSWLWGAVLGYALALCVPFRAWAAHPHEDDLEPVSQPADTSFGNTTKSDDEPGFGFMGAPWPERRSFVISELAFSMISSRINNDDIHIDAELGVMSNVPRTRNALGASVYVSSARDLTTGLNLRYRRWLTDDLALDLAPGVWLADRPLIERENSPYDPANPPAPPSTAWGASARAGLMARDLVGIYAQADFTRPPGYESVVTEWRAGFRTGSYATFAVGGGMALVYGIFIVALLGSSS